MKGKGIGLSLVLGLCLLIPAQAVNKSGTISSNQTWSGEINIVGTVTITSGVVTVSPGTIIKHPSITAHIIIRRSGGMRAIGTAASPITFTTGQASPKKGQWDEIDIMNLENSANTVFKYCNFEYGQTAIDIRNESGRSQISRPTFDHCNFTHFTQTCIYITSGGSPTITNCNFRDCSSGIYVHGGDQVNISYCEVSVASAGIINVGMSPQWYQKCNIDHCTVYDLKIIRTDVPLQHTGFCYYCGTDQGRLEVTNSICHNVQHSGMIISPGWELQNDYNCFYQILQQEVYDGDPGAHSMTVDPLFADARNGDFRLQDSSPCIGAASDGKNIGSSQETVPTGINSGVRPIAGAMGRGTLIVKPNPFKTATIIRVRQTLTPALSNPHPTPSPKGRGGNNASSDQGVRIFDTQGDLVKHLAPASRQAGMPVVPVKWDGSDQAGRPVPGGVYFVRMETEQGTVAQRVVYTP